MTGLPVGRCRNCDAPVSYFARFCPVCHAANLPNPVAVVAALGAVLLFGGAIVLGLLLFRGQGKPPAEEAASASGPSGDSKDDYGWLIQAMAECDEEAKRKLDTLYFLIVPLSPTGIALPGWSPKPISDIGNIGTLLNSTDALLGLRNRVFVLYQKPLTFAVSDPATQTVYKWKPAVGVTSLKSRESGLTSLTLGVELPDVGNEVEWGPTITLNKGTCYWINPLIRPGLRGG
jgi:hypothetical protein